MESERFSALTRTLSTITARRGVLGAMLSTALAGLIDPVGAAERGKKRRQCRRNCRDRCRTLHPSTDCHSLCRARCADGGDRPLDCPDGEIFCSLEDEDLECKHIGTLSAGSGRCYDDLCCCPCGNCDQQHWNEQCNATFPACNNQCKALDTNGWACWSRCTD